MALLLAAPCALAQVATETPRVVTETLPHLVPARTADIGGVSINYQAANLAAPQPTLLLIHGFGASLETWHDVYPALSARFPVVRLDLKGHGFSSKPDDDLYSMEDQARLLAAFIAKLELKRVLAASLCSIGGALEYFFSTRFPRPDDGLRHAVYHRSLCMN